MTILNMPLSTAFSSALWGLQTNTQVWENPFTRTHQTKELPGTRWVATYTYVPQKRKERAEVEAFLAKLRGSSGRFYAFNPINQGLMGVGGDNPKVAGADQVGNTLFTDGWANSATVMEVGDEFQVGNELKRVVEPVLSDGFGNAVIVFEPPLRQPPADNAPIVTERPKCIMRLVDDNQVSINQGTAGFAEITFSAVEVI